MIAVPGHTPGSAIYELLSDGKRIWFMGDTLRVEGFTGDGAEYGWKGDPNYSRDTYIKSIARVWKMSPDTVLTGHGVVRVGGADRLLTGLYEKLLVDRA